MPIALLKRCLSRRDAAIAPFVLPHVPALSYYDMFHESFLLQVEYSLTKEKFYMERVHNTFTLPPSLHCLRTCLM